MNVAELAQEVFEDWKEAGEPSRDSFLDENADQSVPCMTTELFQMVVDDNSLAFLDAPSDESEPFRVLASAIGAEVARLARAQMDAYLEEKE